MKTVTNIFNFNWYFNCPNYRATDPGKVSMSVIS